MFFLGDLGGGGGAKKTVVADLATVIPGRKRKNKLFFVRDTTPKHVAAADALLFWSPPAIRRVTRLLSLIQSA